MRDEFYFPSKDGNTEIHTIEWKPEGEVRAVLQICHGMVEYIRRYDEFAQFLCREGYYVVGNDHLGHGKSIQAKSEYGFFNEKYGNACVLGDMHTLRQRTEKKYPGVPYFMLGHSMGSSLLRQYIQMFMSTVNAYYNVFSGMIGIQRKESVYMIPKGLPVLFVSGADDPVGEFGKGVRKIYEKYRAAGIRDVTLRLYTGDRHEILNETDRDQVYKDLLGWFEKHI